MPRRLVTLFLLLAGCTKAAPPPGPAASAAPSAAPVVVSLASPKSQTLNWVVEQPGTVTAFETTPVVAKLPGFVGKVLVDIGDPVTGPTRDSGGNITTPGQLLAEVLIPELVREAEQKKAMVAVAAAEFIQAERSVDVAKATDAAAASMVAQMQAGLARADGDATRWDAELKRIESLVSQKIIDRQTLDETQKQAKSAAAAKEEVVAKVASAKQDALAATAKVGRAIADVAAADARRNLAAADAERTNSLLEYTHIRAPFAGIVTARNVHTGHYLQPGAGGRPEPLFVVARLDSVRVFLEIPESAAGKAGPGAKAVVRVPALANREYAAAVTRTAGVLGTDSRTLRAEIDLPNPDAALLPGMYAVVRIALSTTDAMTVPAAAVQFADETAYCYRADAGKAVKLRVRVGRADAGLIEVAGFKPVSGPPADWAAFTGAEKLVVGNLGALADGQPIEEKK